MPLVTFGLVAPLGLFGIAVTLRRWRELFPLHAMLGVHFGASLLFIVLSRYRVPVVPLLIVFAAAGAFWMLDALRGRRLRALAVALPALAALVALVHLDLAHENLSMAYYNLGNKYKSLGRWELAISRYQESLRRDPSYLPAWNNLAVTYEQTGVNDAAALETWHRVLAMGRAAKIPKYVERATRRMAALEQRGREGDAGAPGGAALGP